MPTGYTHKLYDGEQSFRDFVLECVSAFFYDGKIEFRVDSYYIEAAEEAQKELDRFNSLTKEDLDREYQNAVNQAIQDKLKYVNERAERSERYKAMLEKVRNFEVPDEYRNLKSFMLAQLEESYKYDVGENYNREADMVFPIQARIDWERNLRKNLEDEVKRTQENLKKEQEIAAERKVWYEQLLKHLEAYEATEKGIAKLEKRLSEGIDTTA